MLIKALYFTLEYKNDEIHTHEYITSKNAMAKFNYLNISVIFGQSRK